MSPSEVRFCTMIFFSFCLNGLRESEVCSFDTINTDVTHVAMSARRSVVKGTSAILVPLVRYARLSSAIISTLDLLEGWTHIRGNHERFFDLPFEPRTWQKITLADALRWLLQFLTLSAPLHGKFTSHSFHIRAPMDQVLLGEPMEIRMRRFSWGLHSQEMASLYFDQTIDTSPV